MNLEEAFDKFGDALDGTVSILIEENGKKYALSELNHSGGTCDCCNGLDAKNNPKVIRIIDLDTMKHIYP